ncbi:MAG: hypothetical protein RL497_2096 [Pseudomonadota bacterium]|jgi:hypothetical protein
MVVNYIDLELAFEFASAGVAGEDAAYLDRESGQILFVSDASEDEIPEDILHNERYLSIPNKKEFDLGKPLVLKFSEEFLPDDMDAIYLMFKKRGAYSAFKYFLASKKQLDNWHQYERSAVKETIVQWCADNGVALNL